jgi:hypothetical protein
MITDNDDSTTLVEEVYLTENEVTRWLDADTPRADRFHHGEGPVFLTNLKPREQPRIDSPPPRSELRALIQRALGSPAQTRQALPARRLERSSEAVWTMFLHAEMVIGVHDDGTVVARDLGLHKAHQFRITSGGDFYRDGRLQNEEDFARREVVARVAAMRDGVDAWARRAKGRKVSQGLRRLWRRVEKAGEINLLWGPKRQ